MDQKIAVTMTLIVPRVPNFVFTSAGKISVGELSDEDLARVGERWTEALIDNAKRQRKEEPKR